MVWARAQVLLGDDMSQEWDACLTKLTFVEVDLQAGVLKVLKNGLQVLIMSFLGVSIYYDVI